MRTHARRRTERQIIQDYAAQRSCRTCACTHHHAVVCQSQQAKITLVNAYQCSEKCYCLCHLDSNGQQVSKAAWECVKARQGRESA